MWQLNNKEIHIKLISKWEQKGTGCHFTTQGASMSREDKSTDKNVTGGRTLEKVVQVIQLRTVTLDIDTRSIVGLAWKKKPAPQKN